MGIAGLARRQDRLKESASGGWGRTLAPALVLALVAGCTTLPAREARNLLPPNAPSLDSVLGALCANDAKVQSVRAEGAVTLQTPDSDAVQRFHNSLIAFRRPTDLYVAGRARTGMLAFRMVSVGKAFLFELPAQGRRDFYPDGEHFVGVGTRISPETVVTELFLSEGWATKSAGKVTMVAFDEVTQTAVLDVKRPKHPRQRVEVMGPNWRVTRNDLLMRGRPIATVTKSDYADVGGVWFPNQIAVFLPNDSTRMEFAFRHVAINGEIEDRWFSIEELERNAEH